MYSLRLQKRVARLVLISVTAVTIFHLVWSHQPQGQDALGYECPSLFFSTYRTNVDVDLEEELETQLLKIQVARENQSPDHGPVRKIWQTSKDGEPAEANPQWQTWQSHNPDWEFKVLSDGDAWDFVSREFGRHIPEINWLWRSYPRPVLRADLLRYLLLWFHGGFYADIDVYPVKSISGCEPLAPIFAPDYHSQNVSLAVGVEIDEPYVTKQQRDAWKWSRTYGFIQYAMYAPRSFSPILRRVIVRALAHSIRHHKQQSRWYSPSVTYTEVDVLEITGPGMFTDAILDVLSETLPADHQLPHLSSGEPACTVDLAALGHRVTWYPFHRLKQPVWVHRADTIGRQQHGGLVVLPINVWGNGQRHSGAENFFTPEACVNHRFFKSWRKSWFDRLKADLL